MSGISAHLAGVRVCAALVWVVGVIAAGCGGGGASLKHEGPFQVTPTAGKGTLIGVTSRGGLVWEPTEGPAVVAAVTPAGYMARSRYNVLEALTPNRRVLWRHPIAACNTVHAIVVDPHRDTFIGCDNRVTAVDAHGQQRWTYTLTGTGWVGGIALAPDGGAYVYGPPPSFDASILVALTPTGAVRWRGTIDKLAGIHYRHGASDAGVAISAATVAANGTLYVGTTDHIAALAADGDRLWQHSITPSSSTLVV
jgi:hypothetical protein